MSKHTPGPWHTGTPFNENAVPIATERDELIGICRFGKNSKITINQAIANAHLFAASPETLARLELMEKICTEACADHDGSYILGPAIAAALPATREAIAKAKGGYKNGTL